MLRRVVLFSSAQVHQIFSSAPNQKLSIKEAVGPTPDIFTQQKCNNRKKIYTCTFNHSFYDKTPWRCERDTVNASFWYPYPLFRVDTIWTHNGVRNLKHLIEKITKHKKSIKHTSNLVNLTMIGNVNIAEEIGNEYRWSIRNITNK